MEVLSLYLLKSSGLIFMFYLAYHFLVQKETFFDGNRWFLLAGLFTSALLPLFFIKKVVWVERPKFSMQDLVAYSQNAATNSKEIQAVEAFDWMQLIWFGYIIIAFVLVVKIVLNLTSLYRMLRQQQIIKKERFKLVNLNENIAPFSFFNYIVYNSDLYSNEELQSILLHEKIHSKERHSLDVMIAKLFCIVFWFNPFIWLYKKAISQNLEYIADQKAIEQLDDRQAYQKALLKVVSHQNCLSITNHFYQSLIKKRIVMLNTNQSQKRNSWKYALILPVLIGFVLLFQIKIIAQEINDSAWISNIGKGDVNLKIDKNCTEEDLKTKASKLQKQGVTLKFSKVKRNSAGEITCIKVSFKDKEGNEGETRINGKEPIKPIHFYKNNQGIGFGTPKQVRVYSNVSHGGNEDHFAYTFNDSLSETDDMSFDFDIIAPEPPEAPELPEMAEAPEAPEAMAWGGNGNSKIVIKKDGKKPVIIMNGKVVSGDESSLDEKELEELINGEGGEDVQVIVNGKDMTKIRTDALANAQVHIKRMAPQMKRQMKMAYADMAKARVEIEKRKPEMERARMDMETARPEMEKAKADMLKAKEEMLQAKEEMMKAKAELEKERAKLKKAAKK